MEGVKTHYVGRPVITGAHSFGIFSEAWIVQRDLVLREEFPCEVCGATGKVDLKTRTEDGSIKTKQGDCWYCHGTGKRNDNHTDWMVVGPCQVTGYEVSAFNKKPGQVIKGLETNDLPYYLYINYHILAPKGYRGRHSCDRDDGELDSFSVHAEEIFASEKMARERVEELNAEMRAKGEE